MKKGGHHKIISVLKISKAKKGKKILPRTAEHQRRLNNSHIGLKHSEENKQKIKDSRKDQISNFKGKSHSKETKNKIRKYQIENPNRIFSNTSIERKIKEELETRRYKKNQDFFQNYPLENIANVDFCFPKQKIVIQCDGDYWHTRKGAKERDKKQDDKLKLLKYKIYRFWESEINESSQKCINLIKELI